MLPLKRILCPTDLSADARSALRAAGEMARHFDAELTILHVHHRSPTTVWPHEGLGISPFQGILSEDEMLAQCERDLAEEARIALPKDLDLKLEVLAGVPATKILETARRIRADMIVIAPRGHNRLRKAIFGTTAEDIVKHSPCPVITLHAGQEKVGEPQTVAAQEHQSRY